MAAQPGLESLHSFNTRQSIRSIASTCSGATRTGHAGTIEIDGNVIATEAASLRVGTPTLALSSIGVGGTPSILVTGSMDASAADAEALSIDSTGHVTVLGPIGANTPFSSVTIIGH